LTVSPLPDRIHVGIAIGQKVLAAFNLVDQNMP
jgi:hypothetical protein